MNVKFPVYVSLLFIDKYTHIYNKVICIPKILCHTGSDDITQHILRPMVLSPAEILAKCMVKCTLKMNGWKWGRRKGGFHCQATNQPIELN